MASTTEVAVSLSWSAPSGNGGKPLTGYVIQWRQDATGNWADNPAEVQKTVGIALTSATYTEADGLAPGRTYNFRISAANEDRGGFWTPGDGSVAATMLSADYDADDDGLIEIENLAQLNAVRWDPDGEGAPSADDAAAYAAAFPVAPSRHGLPGHRRRYRAGSLRRATSWRRTWTSTPAHPASGPTTTTTTAEMVGSPS